MSNIPLVELRRTRLDKVEALRKKGVNPYPSQCNRTHYAAEIVGSYEQYQGRRVTIGGRLMSWRQHGALTFGHVQDSSGRIQLMIDRDTLGEQDATPDTLGYPDLNLVDVGDFVEATGTVTKTRRGEISVRPERLRLLTKSLRPLPDKWSGIKDREAILRRRYLQSVMNPEDKARFESISRMLFAVRCFLDNKGFLEFSTPVLQPQYGGGTARPFTTYVNALDCYMYLSISHELYLKRLIAAGFDKVYTIGKYFRNEGIDRAHHPEFSMIETMTAYENYEYNMDLVEDLFRFVATEVFGKSTFAVLGHSVDMDKPWRRVSMVDAVLEATGVDFRSCTSNDQAQAYLESLGIEPEPTIGQSLVKAFEEKVEPTLIEPTLVFGHPMDVSPLAKPMDGDPEFAERFEIFIGGMECGDNWTEQNDPVYLLELWQRLLETSLERGEECHPLDYDFIEVLEHGMPPTTGIGPGIERMAMIFTEQDNIDDVIFFPIMRPLLSPVNAAIYGINELPSGKEGAVFEEAMTIDEFQTLVEDGLLQPHSSTIIVRPCLRIWDKTTKDGVWKASGHLDLEGFLESGRLILAGYEVKSEEPMDPTREIRGLIDAIELGVCQPIRSHFGNCTISVDPVRLTGWKGSVRVRWSEDRK
jgi:lysyl-tRNA synthetase class 2